MSNKEQMCKCADEMLVSYTTWIFKEDVNVLSPMLTMNSTPHSPHLGESPAKASYPPFRPKQMRDATGGTQHLEGNCKMKATAGEPTVCGCSARDENADYVLNNRAFK